MRILKAVAVMGACAMCCGCGYTFQGSGTVLPPDVKTVYIPPVENNTTEAVITPLVTEALRDRFDRFGAVTVVESANAADAILTTRVLMLKRATDTSTAKTDTTLQQDTVVTLAAELRRMSGPVLWRNPRMMVSYSYGTTSESVLTTSAGFAGGAIGASDLGSLDSREISRSQERQAFAEIADEIAKRIYNEAVAPDF